MITDNHLFNDNANYTGIEGGGIGVWTMSSSKSIVIESNIVINNGVLAVAGRAIGGGIMVYGGYPNQRVRVINNLVKYT